MRSCVRSVTGRVHSLACRVPKFAAALALAWAATVPATAATSITVSAAASLGDAFRAVAAAFEAAHPDTEVRLNVAASGALLQQIAHGAPVDVFASADEATMDQAADKRLIDPGARVDFARNTLVLAVPARSSRALRSPADPAGASRAPGSLADLAGSDVRRVAIGLPGSVPAGRYAKSALTAAGVWPQVEAKMVGAQSVRQVLDYVARGEVDAGFVYATDAALMPGKVEVAFGVATATPVRYPIAPLASSGAPAAARRFIDFVVSPSGRAVLARFGFGAP